MFGLDLTVLEISSPLQRKQLGAVKFKYGPVESNYLKLDARHKNSGIFSLFERTASVDHAALLACPLQATLLADSLDVVGVGKCESIRLDNCYQGSTYKHLPAGSFFYLGGAECEIELLSKFEGGPDISVGRMRVSVCLFDMSVQKADCMLQESIR
ncbi:hypothetical protein B484DRAFT_104703 [Ochromonadaceae sp. CCMP2298]|nr:hypothetical protein B484DRAFT_104703 [Ochromonadaceae sp. CCMP2298]